MFYLKHSVDYMILYLFTLISMWRDAQNIRFLNVVADVCM